MSGRSLEIKQLKTQLKTLGSHEDIHMFTDVTDDTSYQPDIVVAYFTVTREMRVILDKLKKITRAPSLSNEDLSITVNGSSGELIYTSPFFSTFTKKNSTAFPTSFTHYLQGPVS